MSERIPVSVLVQTKNEAVGIAACVRALKDFGEVIVVDSNSEDDTKRIAADCGAQVVNFTWNGRYPKKKQWQLENLETQYEWVLFVDADETPTAQLISELRRIFSPDHPRPAEAAFDINLDYVFAGRVLQHGHRVTKRCLVHKSRARFPVVDDIGLPGMGELEGHYQPVADGFIRRLRGRILHNDLDPVSSWFARHNRYSDWEAHLRMDAALRNEIASKRTWQGRVFDAVPLKPLIFFAYAYIARGGFMDGRAGLDYAIALSTYYWQIGLKIREQRRDG